MNKMQPKNILDADPDEIRIFAVQFLGIDLDPTDDDSTIFAKVMAANAPSENIFVAVEGDTPPSMDGAPPLPGPTSVGPEPVERMAGTLGRDDPKVTLFINNEERNGEMYTRDVSVGVNGTAWLLQRNKPIVVPYRVFEALRLAVRDSVTHDPTTHEENHTPVSAVPFSVQAMPSAAEIAEWRERTASQFCP